MSPIISIEAMTSPEYWGRGSLPEINYSFASCRFGDILIASTSKGICNLEFFDDKADVLSKLKSFYPFGDFLEQRNQIHDTALDIIENPESSSSELLLFVKGTEFQLKVWNILLKIPFGQLRTYGDIARELDVHNGSRAVGTAVGSNPVACLIPCHRVVRSSGQAGGYMWGIERKLRMNEWESKGKPGSQTSIQFSC